MSVMPNATGTHATSKNRIVPPVPQNKLVPTMEKRVSGVLTIARVAAPKFRITVTIDMELSLRAGGNRGINRFAAAAAP